MTDQQQTNYCPILPIGTKVRTSDFGWGEVVHTDKTTSWYSLYVIFADAGRWVHCRTITNYILPYDDLGKSLNSTKYYKLKDKDVVMANATDIARMNNLSEDDRLLISEDIVGSDGITLTSTGQALVTQVLFAANKEAVVTAIKQVVKERPVTQDCNCDC